VAAAVIVVDDDKVVLIRRAQRDRAYGRWILPGGFVDRGEPVPTAARREVVEELGVAVELKGLVGVYSYTDDPVVTVVYEGALADGNGLTCEAGEEALEVRCFGETEIPWNDLGFSSTNDALEAYVSTLHGESV
jgi:ADP-ribose pyrophosphatase YjhB (NUDIX family)